MTAPARYRCNTCGATFTSWSGAERHADEHHGARIDIDLNPSTASERKTWTSSGRSSTR